MNSYNPFSQQQPIFKLYVQGPGIDATEYQTITSAANYAYLQNKNSASQTCSQGIKAKIGGEWFVFCNSINRSPDFCLTSAKNDDMLIFSLDDIVFQICRLK